MYKSVNYLVRTGLIVASNFLYGSTDIVLDYCSSSKHTWLKKGNYKSTSQTPKPSPLPDVGQNFKNDSQTFKL